MRCVGHLSIVGWIRKFPDLLVTKYEGGSLERRHTREDIIQMGLRQYVLSLTGRLGHQCMATVNVLHTMCSSLL
jgi:hypothetical protein